MTDELSRGMVPAPCPHCGRPGEAVTSFCAEVCRCGGTKAVHLPIPGRRRTALARGHVVAALYDGVLVDAVGCIGLGPCATVPQALRLWLDDGVPFHPTGPAATLLATGRATSNGVAVEV